MANKHIRTFIDKYFKSFKYFYKRLKNKIFIRIFLNIGVGVLDGFGLAMFIPLLQMVDDQNSAENSSMGKLDFLIQGIKALNLEVTLITILVVMTIFFSLKGAFKYLSEVYGIHVRQYFVRSLRVELSNALSELSYKSFITSDPGKIQNTMSAEVGRVSLAYQHYFDAFQQLVMVTVYMVFAYFVDYKFALLITVGGLLTNIIFRRVYTRTKEASEKITSGSHVYHSYIIQFVNNFKYLKATGYIKNYNNKLLNSIKYIENNNFRVGKLSSIVNAAREPLLILIISVVIYMQINFLGGSLGMILLSLIFFYRALTSLMLMQTAYNGFLGVSGAMNNMKEFESFLKLSKENDGSEEMGKFSEFLQLKNGEFKYGETTILKDINIVIKKNETIAFVGESGSGKTTLVNILTGLLPLDKGEFYVDARLFSKLKKSSFNKRVGYITQEPVIFSDTIFNNVTFWADKDEDTIKRFEESLKKASIFEFVKGLPKQYDTILGSGKTGITLSGGQKQRISIARELYKQADILVLDEATSALDSETERAIQNGFEDLKGNYTILIVAHRLATIKNANRIALMNKGKIEDIGSYHELLSKSKRFKRMVELQEV